MARYLATVSYLAGPDPHNVVTFHDCLHENVVGSADCRGPKNGRAGNQRKPNARRAGNSNGNGKHGFTDREESR